MPELVPPLTRMLQRARTAARSSSPISSFMVPRPSRSSGLSGSLRNLRIDTTGPSSASGGITTLMRPPSGRRASTIGFDSSSRRPIGARMRRTMRSRWLLSAKRTGMRSSTPCRDTYTSRWPLTRMSSTAGSASRSSIGPKPASSLVSASAISRTSVSLTGMRRMRVKPSTSRSTKRWMALRDHRPNSAPSSSMRVSRCSCAASLMSWKACETANAPLPASVWLENSMGCVMSRSAPWCADPVQPAPSVCA